MQRSQGPAVKIRYADRRADACGRLDRFRPTAKTARSGKINSCFSNCAAALCGKLGARRIDAGHARPLLITKFQRSGGRDSLVGQQRLDVPPTMRTEVNIAVTPTKLLKAAALVLV